MPDPKIQTLPKEMPLSRFWACFFSFSIFAIFWTGKMGKTAKWIPAFILFVMVWFVVDEILYPAPDIDDMFTWNYLFFYEPNMGIISSIADSVAVYLINNGIMPVDNHLDFVSVLSLTMIAFYDVIVTFGSIALLIYLMFRWTTQYNIKNFGYKSKREWKKANIQQRNVAKTIKQYSKDSLQNIKDIGKKTSERIPTEKIKDTSTKAAQKITKTAQNLKPDSRMSEDDKRKQIREWHDMMTMGVITESDFESKKEELLKSKKD